MLECTAFFSLYFFLVAIRYIISNIPRVLIIINAINHPAWLSLAALQRANPFHIITQMISGEKIYGLLNMN